MRSRALAPLILLCAFTSNSFGTDIYVNDPIITGITPVIGSTVFGASYRVENGGGNGDMLLGQTAAASPTAGPSLGRNLGNQAELTTILWNFELEHILGQGFVFTLSRINSSVLVEYIIGWGTFVPALPGTALVSPTLPYPAGTTTPIQPFNAVTISIDTTLQGPHTNTVELEDLLFTSSTLTLSAGSVWDDDMFGTNGSLASQRILLDGDFTQHNWTLTGTVRITKSNNGCPECAIFAVTGSSVNAAFPPDPAAVPEPASLGYTAGGLLLLALGTLRRRK